ncbi:hypothetical protein FQR65_LT05806 [Abscondita terminalis]|nr:hypothetical protein FQR65_LT05806 [Abscondita terminalis]
MFVQILQKSCSIRLVRGIQTTSFNCLDQRWREARGLPMNPNASGVLTDSADYTYLDGSPVPYGTRQKNRINKQKEIAQRIIQLSSEIDYAVERHQKLRIDEEQRKQNIIHNKLKPKGVSLLKKR